MEISLSITERPPVVRAFLQELQVALGEHARVWASMVAGDEHARQRVAAFVQVFEATDREAALDRLEPAILVADPHKKLVTSLATAAHATGQKSTNGGRRERLEATSVARTSLTGERNQSHVQEQFQFS